MLLLAVGLSLYQKSGFIRFQLIGFFGILTISDNFYKSDVSFQVMFIISKLMFFMILFHTYNEYIQYIKYFLY
jgi:hypothetical protein